MKEQITLLRKLQEIEQKIKSLEGDQKRYPALIRDLDEKLTLEKETVLQERERLETLEKARRHKEGELIQDGDKVKKTKGKLFEVKTNKEYQALLHEIELTEKVIGEKEDETLTILEEIDRLKGSLSERQGALATTEGQIRSQISEIEQKLARLVEEIAAHVKSREEIVKAVDPGLMKAYETLKGKRGTALAAVRSGVCQGCYVNVPPQMFNEVQRNDSLIRCPNCNRFLFWENNTQSQQKNP